MPDSGNPVSPARRETESVIVLGGTGWTGRHVCASFAQAGYNVLAIARQPAKRPTWHRFQPLDLAETPVDALAALLAAERPAVVVNAVGRLWGASEQEMHTSFVVVTRRLLEAVARQRSRPRLIQLGTVMEYGPTPQGPLVTEQTPARPGGPYGRLKLEASLAVLAAAEAGDVDGLVLRVVNAAGPGTPTPSLLGKVADSLLRARRAGTRAVVELAPLRARRDYLDIRDAGDAAVSAARSGEAGRIVNIGRGEAVAVRALVDTLIEVSGVPARVEEREPVGAPASAGAGGDWLAIDPETARTHLGWQARRSLEGALRDHWSDALEQ